MFGSGFASMLAKGAEWLNRRHVLCYGDLDEYGLETETADDVAERPDALPAGTLPAGTGKDSGRLRKNLGVRLHQHQIKTSI